LPTEFYMIEVFKDYYSLLLSINSGEIRKNNAVYSGRGCLIAIDKEGDGKNNITYNACRYEDGGHEIREEITLLTPEKTIKKPLVGIVEKDLPKIIEMLGF
jgi:hypothetical protein